jgi:outer membrane biosynthesis protein TonB
MANALAMTDNFESRKNMRAGTITAAILGSLLLLFILVSWTMVPPAPPPIEEGLEVNLGSSDIGSGNDQPFQPGPPAQKEEQQYTPPKAVATEKEDVKDPATDDKDPDAPEIKKPPVTKPEATKVAEKTEVKKTVKKAEPVVNPTPAPPRPKALMKSNQGAGTGGNDADTYKKGSGEGVAGGKGDQGKPGGDPNSKNYEGGGRGNSGVSISRGLEGRRVVRVPSFQDDFNENAKVAVDVRLDGNGKVISATYQPRGSTTSQSNLKAIAIRTVLQTQFNAGAGESFGTIVVNLKIHD